MKTSGEWLGRKDFHEILDAFASSYVRMTENKRPSTEQLAEYLRMPCLGNPSIAVIPDRCHRESMPIIVTPEIVYRESIRVSHS